jgi:hypothetical protein
MNRLQNIASDTPLFVTLNPFRPPRSGTQIRSDVYDHPIFDANALTAQRRLWSLQGTRNTWFCGSYFGSGFHEDGLQAGLAVAEQLRCTAAAVATGSTMSNTKRRIAPGNPVVSAASDASSCSVRELAATVQPRAARRSAKARPIPIPAPVTHAAPAVFKNDACIIPRG